MTRLNDLLCRLNKLLILFIQDNNLCKRLIMSFEQVIYLVKTTYYRCHNLPKRAGTYRTGPELTVTDIQNYQNGAECGFTSHRNEYNGYQKR